MTPNDLYAMKPERVEKNLFGLNLLADIPAEFKGRYLEEAVRHLDRDVASAQDERIEIAIHRHLLQDDDNCDHDGWRHLFDVQMVRSVKFDGKPVAAITVGGSIRGIWLDYYVTDLSLWNEMVGYINGLLPEEKRLTEYLDPYYPDHHFGGGKPFVPSTVHLCDPDKNIRRLEMAMLSVEEKEQRWMQTVEAGAISF